MALAQGAVLVDGEENPERRAGGRQGDGEEGQEVRRDSWGLVFERVEGGGRGGDAEEQCCDGHQDAVPLQVVSGRRLVVADLCSDPVVREPALQSSELIPSRFLVGPLRLRPSIPDLLERSHQPVLGSLRGIDGLESRLPAEVDPGRRYEVGGAEPFREDAIREPTMMEMEAAHDEERAPRGYEANRLDPEPMPSSEAEAHREPECSRDGEGRDQPR
jgi:hypothetical protein